MKPSIVRVALGALSALAVAGCKDRHEVQSLAETPIASRLVGAWDVRFRLVTPLVGRDTAGVPEVSGMVALVRDRWVRHVPQLDDLTHTGSYDIDFRPFGFEPRDVGEVPRAVARTTGRDSVEVLLDPGDQQTPVVMRGALARDTIVGTWELHSTVRGWAGGGAGTFLMIPHQQSSRRSP